MNFTIDVALTILVVSESCLCGPARPQLASPPPPSSGRRSVPSESASCSSGAPVRSPVPYGPGSLPPTGPPCSGSGSLPVLRVRSAARPRMCLFSADSAAPTVSLFSHRPDMGRQNQAPCQAAFRLPDHHWQHSPLLAIQARSGARRAHATSRSCVAGVLVVALKKSGQSGTR